VCQVFLPTALYLPVWVGLETEEGGDGSGRGGGAGVDGVCLHGHRQLRPGDGPAQYGGQGSWRLRINDLNIIGILTTHLSDHLK